jgi:two-component system, NarL family, nitrate/nitrite response regulator NarL
MSVSMPKVRDVSMRVSHRPKDPAQPKGMATNPAEDLTAEELIRRIIQKAKTRSPDLLETGGGAEVILEVELEGMHYALVCSSIKPTHHLSPREQEIVRLVAEGLPNKCISAVLEISSWTVATHLRRIFAKLGVTSRTAMVARLLEEGSITNHPEPQILRRLARNE